MPATVPVTAAPAVTVVGVIATASGAGLIRVTTVDAFATVSLSVTVIVTKLLVGRLIVAAYIPSVVRVPIAKSIGIWDQVRCGGFVDPSLADNAIDC